MATSRCVVGVKNVKIPEKGGGGLIFFCLKATEVFIRIKTSVSDPSHFDVDPDPDPNPGIHIW